MLRMECDQNGDNRIDQKERQYVKENFFLPLKNYDFYTHIKIDKKPITFDPMNFTVSIQNNRLIYAFESSVPKSKKARISVYDEDYFVAFIFKPAYVVSKRKHRVVKDKEGYTSNVLELL